MGTDHKVSRVFLISNFRHVLNAVCFLLGNSLASEFYISDAGELPRRKHTVSRVCLESTVHNKYVP